MPSYFTLRMQFGPHQDTDEVMAQLLQLVRNAPVDEIMFFCCGEEQNNGHDPHERIREWIDRSRPYRQALKKAGVAVSLNPWHTMLHCDRGRTLRPEQDWHRMVSPTGQQASAVVCFLDPAWRDYYFETLRMYAQEDFRVIWIDDDIRYHNHAPLLWGGCFCPLHIAAFNRRAGSNVERDEIVHACLAPGKPHPWRAVWMDTWQDTMLAFLHECRRILDSSGIKMGLMSSSMEAHGAEGRRWSEWWQAFGGGHSPVHRPHFWSYSDSTGQMIIHGIAALDQNRSVHPSPVESGPEIENFPYGRWNKSFRQTAAQMAVAHILGSTNLNISLYDFMGNRPDDEPERASFLKRIRPNMDWLADLFPMTMKSSGVGIVWAEDAGRTVRAKQGSSWFELQCAAQGWATWLGAAGIAFSMQPGQTVNALAGATAWSIDDATLETLLSSGLLLDGCAAEILVERGYGRWIGIQTARWVTQNDVLYSIEESQAPQFGLRVGGQISVNDKMHARRMLQAELEKGALVASVLLNPLQENVGHGMFTFQNSRGGRVAVVPWDANADGGAMMDIHRATQLRRVIDWLAHGKCTGWVDGGAWLVPQFLSNSSMWRGVVWNAGPDEMDTFSIHLPTGMPPIREAWHLTPTGHRLAVSIESQALTLHHPMNQWELVVMR